MWQLCLYLFCSFSLVFAKSDVAILGDGNFDAKTKDGVWFVEFYAPWCGHCKALAPTWEELATELKPTKLNIAKVDATVETKTAAANGVNGYPTLKLFADGFMYEYEGERSKSALKTFVEGGYKEKTRTPRPDSAGPSDVIVLEDADFEDRVNGLRADSDEIWAVEFYAPWCGACKALTPHWDKLGTKFKDDPKIHIAKLDATANQASKDRFAISGYPTIFLFSKGRYYDYRKSRTYDALAEWISSGHKSGERSYTIPSKDTKAKKEDEVDAESDVIVLHDDDFEDKVKSGFEEDWFIEFYAIWCGHCKQLKPVWEILATTLKGDVKVAKLEANQNKKSSDRFAVAGFPTLVLVHQGMYYDYSGARTLAALSDFAKNGYKNTTGASIQPEAGRNDPSEVFQLTDSNFESRTDSTNGGKADWFVEFGSIHCKPCQNMLPAWEWTAKKLRGKVSVGYIEVHDNPELLARFGVNAYPTLILFSGGKMYEYNSTREVQAFQDFALKKGADWKAASKKGKLVPVEFTTWEKTGVKAGWVAQEVIRMFQANAIACFILFGISVVAGALPTFCLCWPKRKSSKVKTN